MLPEKQDLINIILVICAIFLLLISLMFAFFLQYQKKQKKYFEEKLTMQNNFETELVKTEAEVKEQTLQTIAIDLHDNIGQLLSLTRATLSSIDFVDANKSTKKLTTSIELVNTSIKELRQLSKLYQAESLLEKGLLNAIEMEIEHLKKLDLFTINLAKSVDKEYSPIPKIDLFIFRLLQESFNNIIKHANASTIDVTIQLQKNILQIIIEDNGIGFDTSLPTTKLNGLGLTNMKKRVALIGGQILISSELNKGTSVYIEVPYEKNN